MIDPKFADYLIQSDDEEGKFDIVSNTPKDIVAELREADAENYRFYGEHLICKSAFDKFDDEDDEED